MTFLRFLHNWSLVLALVLALAATASPARSAGTVWDGPLLTYNQPAPDPTQATNQDRLTPGVWLTRTNSGGLFNAAIEKGVASTSPADTEWAFGNLTNAAALPYTNWLAWLNGKSPTTMVGSNLVVHLVAEDIYLSFKFTFWASRGAGGFTYQRSTPARPVLFADPTNGPDGTFRFLYTAFPGQSYQVEGSPDLWHWSPIATNIAAGTLIPVAAPRDAGGGWFFRVSQ